MIIVSDHLYLVASIICDKLFQIFWRKCNIYVFFLIIRKIIVLMFEFVTWWNYFNLVVTLNPFCRTRKIILFRFYWLNSVLNYSVSVKNDCNRKRPSVAEGLSRESFLVILEVCHWKKPRNSAKTNSWKESTEVLFCRMTTQFFSSN